MRIKPNPKNASATAAAVVAEGEKVLKAISAQEQVILLDERGRDMSSEDMALIIAQVPAPVHPDSGAQCNAK